MIMLDRKKHFLIVSGQIGASFEQDGRLFNAAGQQVNDEGDVLLTDPEPIPAFSGKPPETEQEAREELMKLTKKQLVDIVLGGSKFASPAPDYTPTVIENDQPDLAPVSEPESDFNALRSKFEVEG
ncbi:MAG: hypothetical protein ABFD97_18280 [Syntrophobacter sp.]